MSNQTSVRPDELTEAGRAKILATLRGEATEVDRGILEALRGEDPAADRRVLEALRGETPEPDQRILAALRGEPSMSTYPETVLREAELREAAPRPLRNMPITEVMGR